MAYSNIDKPSDYFNTVLYTGDGTTSNAITGVGFQPDLVWLKNRSTVAGHHLADVVRGKSGTNYLSLSTDTTAAEAAQGDNDGVNTIGSDGFTVGYTNSTAWNNSGNNYASWNWLAGGTASSNTDGDITSSVSANTTSGFSIVSWTGSGASNTIGHGLSSAPQLVIVKNRTDSATDWRIGNSVVPSRTFADGNGYYLEFDTGAIANPGSQTIWGSPPANPTSTVFKVGSNNSNNGSGDAMIAYCFAEKKGYSKFGTYTGNGSTDGTFVYTGFKPAFLIVKRTDVAKDWILVDNKRDSVNFVTKLIFPNTSGAEDTAGNPQFDFYSNGFKLRQAFTSINQSGGTYFYMAFAESPLVGSNFVPNNAR